VGKHIAGRSLAAIVDNGRFIGLTMTALRGGDWCCYGRLLPDGALHQYGTGKISRAKKWLTDENEVHAQRYDVNQGGGGAS
jgi:hypothetical protein